MAISTRFRARSFAIRLATWVLTVLRPMYSSSAISTLVAPRATVTRISSSRAVSGSMRLSRRRAREGVGERGKQPRRHARGDERVAVGGSVDRLHEELGSGVLEQEATGAGLQSSVHVLVEIERRDDHDRDRVGDAGAGELARGLDAVHVRHADVQEAHVGA